MRATKYKSTLVTTRIKPCSQLTFHMSKVITLNKIQYQTVIYHTYGCHCNLNMSFIRYVPYHNMTAYYNVWSNSYYIYFSLVFVIDVSKTGLPDLLKRFSVWQDAGNYVTSFRTTSSGPIRKRYNLCFVSYARMQYLTRFHAYVGASDVISSVLSIH